MKIIHERRDIGNSQCPFVIKCDIIDSVKISCSYRHKSYHSMICTPKEAIDLHVEYDFILKSNRYEAIS